MNKVILKKFIAVILLALCINGILCRFLTFQVLSDNIRKDLLALLRIIDYQIDYSSDIQEQVELLNEIITHDDVRITILSLSGNVLADTQLDNISEFENYIDRKEIKSAIETGEGYIRGNSKTDNTIFTYVAKISKNNDFIIRIAAPYSKINQNIYMLITTIIVNVIMALMVSVFLALRFSKTIVIPLREISGEISKLGDRQPKFEFKEYKYDELNSISVITKHMSETINETMERLEQEKVIRQEFFSNVSHELKTPITSIGGYAEMLENNLVTDENMRQDFLRRIKKEVLKMTSLINDILMISKLETKEIKRKFTKVRIGAVVEDVLATLMPVAKDADIELKVNYMPITMLADEEHIRQLITNLLSNAIKYNKSGGYAMLDIKEEGKNIIIEVMDNGVGIPENSLNRVFERFYRVDSGRSKKVGGTGLGLSIVKHIVQHYGGKIAIKSKEDVGTQIVVNMPNLPML